MPYPNVFDTNPAFSQTTLTATVNKDPHAPGRIQQLGIFDEEAITTTSVQVEERAGELVLVADTPRGGTGQQFKAGKRTLRSLVARHLKLRHTLNADEIQDLREFGSESQLADLESEVTRRLMKMSLSIEVTKEHMLVGALRGQLLDSDGSTVLINYFTEFGVSQITEFNFELDTDTQGAVQEQLRQLERQMAEELKGIPLLGVRGFMSGGFADALHKNKEFRESYTTPGAGSQQQRAGHSFSQVIDWGGVLFEEYRGSVNGVDFIPANKCIFVPIVAPGSGVFKMHYAPGDFFGAVNRRGLPMYARQFKTDDSDTGRTLEVQASPLPMPMLPRTLMVGRKT
jgi:hypothetical protein